MNLFKVINEDSKTNVSANYTVNLEYDFAYLVYALYHIKFLHLAATLIYFSKPISELLPSRNK